MSEAEVVNTTHMHDSRPFIVKAEANCPDGRHVEGVGVSLLTRGRAVDKAIDRAQQAADETDIGFEILNVDYRGVSVAMMDSEMQIRSRGDFFFPPYKARVSATKDGKSADGSSSSFLRFSGTVRGAVEKAESQLDRMA